MSDTSNIPKMQSRELNSDGRPINLPGVYRHKDSGAEYITPDGDEGVAQADALMTPLWKDAWERVGDVPSRVDILAMNKAQQIKDAAAEKVAKDADKAEMDAAVEDAVKAATPAGGETYVPKAVATK